MSIPTQNASAGPARTQASIRSFFQPTQPRYSTPPSASRQAQSTPPPPSSTVQQPPAHPEQPEEHLQITTSPSTPPSPPPLPLQQSQVDENGPRPPTTKTHHPNITISPIHGSHIAPLRRLTSRLLQVRYPDTFYAALTDPLTSGIFSRVLLWTDSPTSNASDPSPKPTVIGGLVCRPISLFQARPTSATDLIPNALYVQSLVLLEPYRHLGLATALLDDVCRVAARDGVWGCETVCAHVWTENQDGMEWYKARGFAPVDPVVEGYYRALKPDGAWIVRRDIGGRVSRALTMNTASENSQPTSNGPAAPPDGSRRLSPAGVTSAVPKSTNSAPPAMPSAPPAPPPNAGMRPGPNPTMAPGQSYQNARPGTEWNDLPVDMQVSRNTLAVPGPPGSGASSAASSRSSSMIRKKRDRAYPAAAFGK